MKIAACFLAVLSCALAMPAAEEVQFVPNNIYLEPINPVVPQAVDLPGGRIIGGSEVARNSIPYQVAVIINNSGFCGGSLISTTRILTAAHCTVSASFVEVRLGAHAFNTNEATQVRVTSSNVVNHGSYNVGSFAGNDVAVIILSSALSLNNNIAIIALAASNGGTFEGSTALLTGWGRTSDASSAISAVLNGVTLSILSNAACRNIYGDDIVQGSICTSGAGIVGACNGDSGGPLVVNGLQVGVVSFGSAMCQAGNPTVFARITHFRTWIQQYGGV